MASTTAASDIPLNAAACSRVRNSRAMSSSTRLSHHGRPSSTAIGCSRGCPVGVRNRASAGEASRSVHDEQGGRRSGADHPTRPRGRASQVPPAAPAYRRQATEAESGRRAMRRTALPGRPVLGATAGAYPRAWSAGRGPAVPNAIRRTSRKEGGRPSRCVSHPTRTWSRASGGGTSAPSGI